MSEVRLVRSHPHSKTPRRGGGGICSGHILTFIKIKIMVRVHTSEDSALCQQAQPTDKPDMGPRGSLEPRPEPMSAQILPTRVPYSPGAA